MLLSMASAVGTELTHAGEINGGGLKGEEYRDGGLYLYDIVSGDRVAASRHNTLLLTLVRCLHYRRWACLFLHRSWFCRFFLPVRTH